MGCTRQIKWYLGRDAQTGAILDFKIFPKRQKAAENYWKEHENNETVQKESKKVRIS